MTKRTMRNKGRKKMPFALTIPPVVLLFLLMALPLAAKAEIEETATLDTSATEAQAVVGVEGYIMAQPISDPQPPQTPAPSSLAQQPNAVGVDSSVSGAKVGTGGQHQKAGSTPGGIDAQLHTQNVPQGGPAEPEEESAVRLCTGLPLVVALVCAGLSLGQWMSGWHLSPRGGSIVAAWLGLLTAVAYLLLLASGTSVLQMAVWMISMLSLSFINGSVLVARRVRRRTR